MLRALDHIIIGVNDLAQATETFEHRLGLLASGGGSHPTGGTANRIIVIGDTYLELITICTPAEAQQSMIERLAKGDGYVNFVLASNDITGDSQAIAARGTPIVGPKAGELTGAEGHSRAWMRTDIERPDMAQHYPFIIQHDSTGKERRFRLAGWQTPPEHPLGATRVLSATISVENLDEAAQRFQHIYGLQPSEPFSGAEDGWDATLISFLLGAGTQSCELAAPGQKGQEEQATDIAEPGGLAHHVQCFGENLCRITLAVKDLPAARHYLDTHDVAYTYQDTRSPLLWIREDQAAGAAIVLREA